MATNTAGSVGRQFQKQAVHYLRKNIVFGDATVATTVGYLPPGALVIGGGVIITTAFNAAGDDTMDVGTSGTADGFTNDAVVSTIGNIVFNGMATSAVLYSTSARTVVATYSYTSTAPTAGSAEVWVKYLPDNDR